MRRISPAGRKSAVILPKVIASCLADASELPYNWSEKVRAVVLGICLARSTVLQDIARTRRGKVKHEENDLSELLSRGRLDLRAGARQCAIRALRRIGRRRFLRYRGKLVLLIDTTSYEKLRSRGKQKRMPQIGKVRLQNVPIPETVLVPGYNEFWTGLLLKDKTCLGITRRLFTELTAWPSQNALEEAEIRRAIELVKEAFGMGVILVADRGFRRKELLEWLRKDLGTDFVIRIEGKLTVRARGWEGLLWKLAPHWPERLRRYWRDRGKDPILSAVRAAAVTVAVSGRSRLRFNALCLTPLNREMEPLFLATTLPIETRDDLSTVVQLYSSRWTVETFFFSFKQSLGAGDFRVFSCWEAIDRLLAMAHMAFLVLYLLLVLAREARTDFWDWVQGQLREWFARPPELTLGQFFEIVARGFGERRSVGASA